MKDETGAKIRVLIVDDIPETRENLKKLLYFESDIEVVGLAGSGQEAVDLAVKLQPDIVLMDINMPGMDGITAGELIAQRAPMSQIIMMSVQSEADYLRRSMRAGAREFLIKPFSSDELASTIRRVYELIASRRVAGALPEVATAGAAMAVAAQPATAPAARPANGHIIAVYSPKGGVGCSTVAINLAVALREIVPNAKVILVDANLQFGGVDVLLNLQSPRTIINVVEKVNDLDAEVINSVAVAHASGIKVLLAPPRPEMADLVTAENLEEVLKLLKRTFDFIVVDTRSALHDVELTILDQASRIVLVTTPEIPSIRNVKLFFDVTNMLQYPADKIKMIINQADRRGAIRPDDIESSLRHPATAVIPLDERVAATAVNQGVPLVMTHRNCLLAQGIVDLARRLYLDLQPPAQAAQDQAAAKSSDGLLRKLFR
jgi:pilus assembly protein CpaE